MPENINKRSAVHIELTADYRSASLAMVEHVARKSAEPQPGSGVAIPRLRSTSTTARRIEKLVTLVGEFSTREMVLAEIACFLEFSNSGARKYTDALLNAGVIEVARYIGGSSASLGTAVYRIISDSEKIKASLVAIRSQRGPIAPRKAKSVVPEQSLAGHGRHFHVLADDTFYAIRVHRSEVARDPLVAALFGPARPEKNVTS